MGKVSVWVEVVVPQDGVPLFSIKGLKGGPTFLFDDQASFSDVITAVEEELTRANGFFRGSPIVLHFGGRVLRKEEWWQLKDTLHREGLLLRYAVARSPTSRDLLYKEGLPVRENLLSPRERKKDHETAHQGDGALYLRRGMRGGQKQVFHGDVLLVGDVNQGAEIIAGGDVVVVGTLRGVVHAGYPDNRAAAVVALNLMPLQLRIGPLIAIPEDGQNHRGTLRTEVARIFDDEIVIEPYNGKL